MSVSFEEVGRTYVGCMQKVFDVEIDLVLMLEAEQRGQFGAVRANRRPLPMCRVEVEACYEGREVQGASDVVLSRGSVIVRNDEFTGRKGHGQFVKRGTADFARLA